MAAELGDISETALWAAAFRAREADRTSKLFADPFAKQLAGSDGERLARGTVQADDQFSWVVPIRTVLFDTLIEEAVATGVRLVINLGAGLDTRPYRLALPAHLRWIEVDAPRLLAAKADALRETMPRCHLDRIGLDLADRAARRPFLDATARGADSALVVTEGLLVYLAEREVALLGQDLAERPGIAAWVADLHTPMLLRAMRRVLASRWTELGAAPVFAPHAPEDFFARCGWRIAHRRSMLEAAASLCRLPPGWQPSPTSSGEAGTRRIDGWVVSMTRP